MGDRLRALRLGPLLGRGVARRVLGEATQEQRRARAPQRAGGAALRRAPRRLPREVRGRDKSDNLGSRIIQREEVLFRYGKGLALVFALARAMVVLAEELVALAVDPLLQADGQKEWVDRK